jgi:hypothetical protein
MKANSLLGFPSSTAIKTFAATVSAIANEVLRGRSSDGSERQSKVSQEEVVEYFEKYEPGELALVIRENPLWAAAEVLGLPRSEVEADGAIWDRFRRWRGRVTENQVALAVCQIAANEPNRVATFARLKREIPQRLNLSAEDRIQSATRPNEEMWEQLIRNIKSHSEAPGNYIKEGYLEHLPKIGYRVTRAGLQRARRDIA